MQILLSQPLGKALDGLAEHEDDQGAQPYLVKLRLQERFCGCQIQITIPAGCPSQHWNPDAEKPVHLSILIRPGLEKPMRLGGNFVVAQIDQFSNNLFMIG